MSAPPTVGATCFFCSRNQSWVLGTIESADAKETFTCKTRGDGTKGCEQETVDKLKKDDLFVITNLGLLDEDPSDLLMLTLLHESTIMHSLNQRYFQDVIYTNIGPIIVAFNPFKYTIPWYQDDKMPSYLEEGYPIEQNKPHSWAVAHNTYHELLTFKQNQCILVSGESGAGKTEAVKIVMRYLSAMSCKRSGPQLKSETEAVGKKLLQASPILEGFGNAKTVRNDNSSRFGKFMKVQFDSAGLLKGAHTIKYLLEKSRIITAGPGERCYHSFYYVCAGQDHGKFKVQNSAGAYKSLSAGNCLTVDGVSDSDDYNECCEAFKDVGINDEEKDEIWKTVGGVLNLLNVDFKSAGGGDSSEVAGGSGDQLATCAELWQIPGDELQKELLTSTNEVRGEIVTKLHTVTAALDTRDALVKVTYDQLFDWLVNKLNETASVSNFDNFIGLLDIFGFEDFAVNSFEQLCINLANETLQHHYNTYIFNKDIELCRGEGVDVTEIKFPDNTPCLNLIIDKLGILALLDEQCALGKGTDEGFLQKVNDTHAKHEFYIKDRMAGSTFCVRHYAGDVKYETKNFLDKNRDTLKDQMKLLMRSSKSPFIAALLPAPVQKSGKKATVGSFFKSQLQELMDLINSTNPHWIRCIKPHPAKKPQMWHGVNVFTQLSSSGIIGTVKVRKAGFPIRMYHWDFLKRYRILKPGPVDDPAVKCQEIIASLKLDGKRIQVGKTKVFIKNEEYTLLEQAVASAAGRYVAVQQMYARSMYAKVILGEKDFQKNKAAIMEHIKGTFMVQLDERKGRGQIDKAFDIEICDLLLGPWETMEEVEREDIERDWEVELMSRVEREGAALRELEARLAEERRNMLERHDRERVNMVGREEKDRVQILEAESEWWSYIVKTAVEEQYQRDKTREDEKRERHMILDEEALSWASLWEEERASHAMWRQREQGRLAKEWKELIEGVYAVQAERKAAAVAQEKYRYDSKRRQMSEARRQQFREDVVPKVNTTAERRAFEHASRAEREQQFSKREADADQKVDCLRSRKELLIGKEVAHQKQVDRMRQTMIREEKKRRILGHEDGSKHDALSTRVYPSGSRYPLHTHADPPPPYLFSQSQRTTAEEIMAARTPTPGLGSSRITPQIASPPPAPPSTPGVHARTRSPHVNQSRAHSTTPNYDPNRTPRPGSRLDTTYGASDRLFSPVRTRKAAGMDPHGNAVSPMLPQPNPVSPPKLGSWG